MRTASNVLNIKFARAASGPLIAFQNVALTYTVLFSLFNRLVTWLSSFLRL